MLVLLVSVRQRRVLRLRHLDRDHHGMTLFLIVSFIAYYLDGLVPNLAFGFQVTIIGCLVAPIFG